MKTVKSVDDYIASAPKDVQPKLRQLQKAIKETAPQAIEKISYQMPYYGYKGRLIYFAHWKHHVAVYAMPVNLEEFKDEVKKYLTSKSTLKFALDENLPIGLIKKLVKAQVRLNETKKG